MKNRIQKIKIFIVGFSVILSFMIFVNLNQIYPKLESNELSNKNDEVSLDRKELFMYGYTGPKPEEFNGAPTHLGLPKESYSAPRNIPSVINIIVILVRFSDLSNTLSKSSIESKIFGVSNSLADYYYDVTNGYTTIQGDVTDWLTLPLGHDFYGTDGDGTDNYYQEKFYTFMDFIDLADPYVNYANYDKVVVIHAGTGQEDSAGSSTDIWSSAYRPVYGSLWTRDGSAIETVSVCPEIGEIGVLCHEFGHQNNLPDLYDTSGNDNDYCDHWALMDSGSWNGATGGSSPAFMMGWCRNYLGLIPGTKIKTVNDNKIVRITLDNLAIGGDNYLLAKLPLETSSHYYLLEARFKSGYDTYLPNEGLLITEINENLDNGQGIVNIMDSTPGSYSVSDKDDGHFTVSDENTYGAFHDFTYGVHIIVEDQGANWISIMIDRYFDWTFTQNTISNYQMLGYNLGTLTAGQECFWNWNVISGQQNIDCFIERVSDHDWFCQINDVNHDSGVFKAPTDDEYVLYLNNNYGTSGVYKINIEVLTPPDTKIKSSVMSSTSWVNDPFSLTASIWNEGGSTDDSIIIQLNLPAGISLQTGSNNQITTTELGWGEILLGNWQLIADAPNTYQIDIQYSSESCGTQHLYKSITINHDLITPEITISGTSDNSITNDNTIYFAWNCYDQQSGIKENKIYINNSFITTLAGSLRSYTTNALSDGYHEIKVETSDYGGNINSTSKIYLVDTMSPTVEISTDVEWISSFNNVTFTINCDDDSSGIDYAELYYRDGGTWKYLDTEYSPISTFLYTTSLSLAYSYSSYVDFYIVLFDKAGNYQESDYISLSIDNTAPLYNSLDILSENGGGDILKGIIDISFSTVDFGSGVDYINIKITKNSETLINKKINNIDNTFFFSFNSKEYITGSEDIHINIDIVDKAGNVKSYSSTYIVNNSSPFNIMWIIIPGVLLGISLPTVAIVSKKRKSRMFSSYSDFNVKEKPKKYNPTKKTSKFSLDDSLNDDFFNDFSDDDISKSEDWVGDINTYDDQTNNRINQKDNKNEWDDDDDWFD